MTKTHPRRNFIKKIGIGTIGMLPFFSQRSFARKAYQVFQEYAGVPEMDLASEEEFWYYVRECFSIPSHIINLNNAGVSPSPKTVQEFMKRNHDMCMEVPSYNMWQVLDKGREPLRERLAKMAGADTEEIALNRNTSEALETIIFGMQLKAGDQVILSKQDYPNMINAWKQREKRDGIQLIWVDLDLPSEDTDYLVQSYTNKFGSRTKVVHITHVINWNGQILPVRQIAEAARRSGIDVLVDGAHSFAHFDFQIRDLECDYFGTSLHKWMMASIGTGFLYVRKEKIKDIYPLFASEDPLSDDIRKFEVLGTRPFYTELSVQAALDFYQLIGPKRKEERLRYLRDYWIDGIKGLPDIVLNTSMNRNFSCGIANFSIRGREVLQVYSDLFNRFRIHTSPVERAGISGIRISPNVYTSLADLDRLIQAITEIHNA